MAELSGLMADAARLRDRGHGRLISFNQSLRRLYPPVLRSVIWRVATWQAMVKAAGRKTRKPRRSWKSLAPTKSRKRAISLSKPA